MGITIEEIIDEGLDEIGDYESSHAPDKDLQELLFNIKNRFQTIKEDLL